MMLRSLIAFCFLLISGLLSAQLKVRLEISSDHGNRDTELFVAGSFNGWNPGNKNYRFSKENNTNYFLEFSLNKGFYEFKITRGSWDKVECNANGSDISNRMLRLESDTTIFIKVEAWKDQFTQAPEISTAGKNVQVMDTAFLIPQLSRTRRIWLYLPQGYASSNKRYPVLYMHDGQNVFDNLTSYSGEWGVDECLDTLGLQTKECIVVAVDNGADKRLNEYCPYDFSLSNSSIGNISGKGEGKAYVDFLVKTLKPLIDKKYRTLPGRENTFVAGSSMGGLISMYAVLQYPEVFGGAGVFSPAFWVGPAIFDDIKTLGRKAKARIYFYAGDAESDSMVPDTEKAYNLAKQIYGLKTVIIIRKEGQHNEARWRQEFPLFYKWMMN